VLSARPQLLRLELRQRRYRLARGMVLKEVPQRIDDVPRRINHLHMHVLKTFRPSFSINSNTSHRADGLPRINRSCFHRPRVGVKDFDSVSRVVARRIRLSDHNSSQRGLDLLDVSGHRRSDGWVIQIEPALRVGFRAQIVICVQSSMRICRTWGSARRRKATGCMRSISPRRRKHEFEQFLDRGIFHVFVPKLFVDRRRWRQFVHTQFF